MRVANFEKVLRVINNTEPFRLCVYPNEEKENNKNNNYKELFNGFKDDELKEKLIENNNGNHMNEEEGSKSYLQYQKIFNSLMFVCLHCFFEFLLFFFVLPKLNSAIYYHLFWLLIVTLFASFYLANKSDPGFIEPKDNLTWLEMVENKININDFCPYCRIKRTNKIKHCHVCKKCIKGFDHHCNWIDNCVGDNNKTKFLFFICITMTNLLFNIFIGIVDLRNGNEKYNNINNSVANNLEAVMDMKWMLDFKMNDLISILVMIVSGFFTIPVTYILFSQLKGIFIKENH
jgi:hypothetical protein